MQEEYDEEEGFETAKDIAEYLKMKLRTVYFLTANDIMPHYRISPRIIRYKKSEIKEWAKSYKITPRIPYTKKIK